MTDLIKFLVLTISIIVFCLYLTLHCKAKSPDLEPDLSAILASLEQAHVVPSTLRYGSPNLCEADTQTILFVGVSSGLQRQVQGIVCCHGNFCFIQHLEVSQ